MKELRSQFRAIVLGITGIIIAILVFRIAVDLLNAPSSNILVGLIRNLSDILITPFRGIIVLPNGALSVLNIDALVAISVYILGAITFIEIVTGFMHENIEDIIQNVVDGIFKFIEFVLILRIVFELFAVTDGSTSPGFVKAIYGLTFWSQGILFRIPFGNGFLDLSAIVCLIIIAVIDALTERFLDSLFKQFKTYRETRIVKKKSSPPPAPVIQTPVMQPVIQPQQRMPQQNITINVPAPQNHIISHQAQPILVPVPVNPANMQQVRQKPKAIQGKAVNEG